MAYCTNLCEQYRQNPSFDALNDDPLEVDPDIVGKGVHLILPQLQSI